MRIGLISDTHIPDHAKELPAQLKEVFDGVDLILHAGDVYDVAVLDELERIAPILVAEGDDDSEVLSDSRVKKEQILTVDGVTIWLIHEKPQSWYQNKQRPDVIVYGHTHRAKVEDARGRLLISPGSPTFPHYKTELGTVAILTVNSGKAEVEIVQLQ